MTEKTFAKIYGIADQEGRIMYIGKANNPTERMKQHLRECKRRKTPLHGWINKCLERGQSPHMIVLASATSDDWQSLETQMIAQYRADGKILNLADGGDQPKTTTEGNRRNAETLNAKLKSDPRLKKIRELKQYARDFIKRCNEGQVRPETAERLKAKLRLAGHKNPALFGEYRFL